jgi:hypothetical protein
MPKPVRRCCCGKDITTLRANARFCSPACRMRVRRSRARVALAWGRNRRCQHCGGRLVIGLDTLRSDRKYCLHANATCRQKAYRQRKAIR